MDMNIFELAKIGTPEEIREAVKKGADVNDQMSDGLTPLFIVAAENDNADSRYTFLELGADPHIKDRFDKTALDYARENELMFNDQTCEILMKGMEE